ncbi:MAG: DUF4251 domain-containing protein, partial [Porphyromonadaceae bacterium]|nr:DUF4251 domain-containing protein [Porphyromonadaceae bacterium]
ATQLAEEQRILNEKIESGKFIFEANYVIPMGNFQPRHLTSSYDVKVTQDTIYSHLAYFGVAYEAPWNPAESPLVFKSLNFSYNVVPGKKRGSWMVEIRMNDLCRQIRYLFTIWENGKADLAVWDTSRQAITFRGEISP